MKLNNLTHSPCLFNKFHIYFDVRARVLIIATDEESDPYKRASRSNILMVISCLLNDCSSGVSFVFQFSSYYGQEPEDDNDELDSKDETICSLDWERSGDIRDDEINEIIICLPRQSVARSMAKDGTKLFRENLYTDQVRGYWPLHTTHAGVGLAQLDGAGSKEISTPVGDDVHGQERAALERVGAQGVESLARESDGVGPNIAAMQILKTSADKNTCH
nr:metacaspase-1-like [Lolium perenne]